MSEARKPVSANPKTFHEGSNSGLFDNVDFTIQDVKVNATPPSADYQSNGSLFAHVAILLDGDAPVEERTVSQSYPLGRKSGELFDVSEDGYTLYPKEGIPAEAAILDKRSNWGQFLTSLANEGLSEAILDAGDYSKFKGLRAHGNRVLNKVVDEINKKEGRTTKFPPQIFIVTKLLDKAKGSAAGAAATAATGTKTPAATAPAGDFNLDDVCKTALATIISDKGGSVQRGNLGIFLTKWAVGNGHNDQRADIAKRGADEGFIKALAAEGLVKYDPAKKGEITLA